MTQSAEHPYHRPDRAAPDQVGEPEPTGHSAEIAERIWGRYGGSPGVIPMPAALARHVSRLSTGRLPLLASVQRRWASAHSPFPPGPLGLPYARLPGSATPWSPPAYAVQSTREKPSRGFGAPGPASWDAGRVSPRHTTSARAVAGVSTPQSAAGKEAQLTEVRAAQLAASEGTELGAAIWQRHLSGPAGRAIQYQGAETELVHPERPHVTATTGREAAIQQRHLSGPAGRAIQHQGAETKPVHPERPHVTATTEREAAIRRRPLGDRAGRTTQHQVRPTERGPAEGRTTAGARAGSLTLVEGAPQPSGERGRPATGVGVASPTKVETGDLGAAILRRHLSGAVVRTIQPQGAPPGSAHPDVRTGKQSLARLADPAMPQRLAPPARIASEALPVSEQPAMLQTKMNQVVPATVAGSGQMSMAPISYEGRIGPVAFGAGRAPLPWAATRAGETTAMRQLAMPLSRTALPGMAMLDGAFGASREPFAASPALPLQRAAERGAIGARVESGMAVSAPARFLGAPLDLPLQRAAVETPVGAPATATSGTAPPTPAEEPPAPTATRPGLEGPDLERLADEVITIIERRLIVERESLGLPTSDL